MFEREAEMSVPAGREGMDKTLEGKPCTNMTISHGRYFFVRHAPALMSPLCCLILRLGLTVKPT